LTGEYRIVPLYGHPPRKTKTIKDKNLQPP
jgi:hypothetical protein